MKWAPCYMLGDTSVSRSGIWLSDHLTVSKHSFTLPTLRNCGHALPETPEDPRGKASGFGGESSLPLQRLILQIIQRLPLPQNYLICSKQDEVLEEYRFWGQSQVAAWAWPLMT